MTNRIIFHCGEHIMERSARSLVSVSALVVAVLLAMNYTVQEAPVGSWWPALALVALALLVWAMGRYMERPSESVAAPPPMAYTPPAPPVRRETSAPPPPSPAAQPAKPADKPDDLTIIEGIGPKMSAALAAAGIDTYAKLAKATEDDLHAAVEAAGMRLAPSLATWAQQAAYAAKGDMAGLEAFQGTLKGGRKSKK
jgi:predicted flap endonuclease-1-like 5' DNA nuclease